MMKEFNPEAAREAWTEFGNWFNESYANVSIDPIPGGTVPIPKIIKGKCEVAIISAANWDKMKEELLAWIAAIDGLHGRTPGAPGGMGSNE